MSYSKAKGQAETLRLALKNATHVINQRGSTMRLIREAIGPLMTFDWDTSVLRIFGAGRVNNFLQLLRSTILPQKDYAALDNLVKGSTKGFIFSIPPDWDTWAICVRKFRAQAHIDWGNLITIANVLRTHDIDTPCDLAMVHKPRIEPRELTNDKTTTLHIRGMTTRYFRITTPSASST